MLKLVCDRCGSEFPDAKLGTSLIASKDRSAVSAFVVMPEGWQRTLRDEHICGACMAHINNDSDSAADKLIGILNHLALEDAPEWEKRYRELILGTETDDSRTGERGA